MCMYLFFRNDFSIAKTHWVIFVQMFTIISYIKPRLRLNANVAKRQFPKKHDFFYVKQERFINLYYFSTMKRTEFWSGKMKH